MKDKLHLWWFPGAAAIPIVIVAPSLGLVTLFMCIAIMILLRQWSKRCRYRVAYVNDQIDKGVIFKKLTMEDQLQYRRKRMILNHENVSHYVRTRRLMCLIMIPLIAYVLIYANIVWFRDPSDTRAVIRIFYREYWQPAAIITSVLIFILLSASALMDYFRVSYFASCLKEPNQPRILTEREKAEKEEAIEKARENASNSGFISSIANKQVDEEAVEEARRKVKDAGENAGMLSSIAHADLSQDRPQMTRDERIEAAHQAELERQRQKEDSK